MSAGAPTPSRITRSRGGAAFAVLVATILVAYAGIAVVTVSQLGGGAILALPGEITHALGTINVPSLGAPSHGPGGSAPVGGHGQYPGLSRGADVRAIRLRPGAGHGGSG